MKRIWAPWRQKFLMHPKPKGCIFCQEPKQKSARGLIIERGRLVYSMLNLYPYNNGHTMITTYRHLKSLSEYTDAEGRELFEFLKKTTLKLDRILKPQGYNIGFNIARAGGASFDKHMHMHIVPRYIGDTNFMPVVAGDKVISHSLYALKKALRNQT